MKYIIYDHNNNNVVIKKGKYNTITKIKDDILSYNNKPFICFLNGFIAFKASWNIELKDNDCVIFYFPLLGRDNKEKSFLQFALLAATLYFPPMATNSLGKFGVSMLQATMIGAGSVAINALFPPDEPINHFTQLRSNSPSLTAQTNIARYEEVIPEWFGTNKIYPDLACIPYVEYHNNKSVLHQLFCVGIGKYEIIEDFFEDTSLKNLPEKVIEKEIVYPNQTLNLFWDVVKTSSEVSNQELDENWLYFTASTEKSSFQIAIDICFPRGLGKYLSFGALTNHSVGIKIEISTYDSNNPLQAEWKDWGISSITASILDNYTCTYFKSFNGGCQIRIKRTTPKSNDILVYDEMRFLGLRSYHQSKKKYGNITLIGLKITSDETISNLALKKYNIVATRIGKKYDEIQDKWIEKPTNDISSAVYSLTRYIDNNNQYNPDKIDLAFLQYLEITYWRPKQYVFNGGFDTEHSFWEALQTILRVGRAKAFSIASKLYFFHDSSDIQPKMILPVIKDSLREEISFFNNNTPDAIIIEFINEQKNWIKDEIICTDKDNFQNPSRIRLYGITNIKQAYREGMYLYSTTTKHKVHIEATVMMEGRLVLPGDLVVLSYTSSDNYQCGEILNYSNNILTPSIEIKWIQNEKHFISLKKMDGSYLGPFEAIQRDNNQIYVKIDDFIPYCRNEKEKTNFIFGNSVNFAKKILIYDINPSDDEKIQIKGIEYQNVYEYDNSNPPENIDIENELENVEIVINRDYNHKRIDIKGYNIGYNFFTDEIILPINTRRVSVHIKDCYGISHVLYHMGVSSFIPMDDIYHHKEIELQYFCNNKWEIISTGNLNDCSSPYYSGILETPITIYDIEKFKVFFKYTGYCTSKVAGLYETLISKFDFEDFTHRSELNLTIIKYIYSFFKEKE